MGISQNPIFFHKIYLLLGLALCLLCLVVEVPCAVVVVLLDPPKACSVSTWNWCGDDDRSCKSARRGKYEIFMGMFCGEISCDLGREKDLYKSCKSSILFFVLGLNRSGNTGEIISKWLRNARCSNLFFSGPNRLVDLKLSSNKN